MAKRMQPVFLIAALGTHTPVHAATHDEPVEVGIVVEPLVAIDLANDRAGEDTGETWTWIRAEAGQRLSHSRWFLGIHAEHQLRWGEDVEGIWDVRAGESGWAGTLGPLHLRTGVVIERWGKLDLLPVVDVLNPRDLRAGPLATLEATRIPLAMATLQGGSDHIRAELTLIPFAGSDRVQIAGSDWSLIRPGMLEGYLGELRQWEGGLGTLGSEPLSRMEESLNNAHPSSMRALGQAMDQSGMPEALALNGEAAVRVEAEGRGIDGALMAGALRSRVPSTVMDPRVRKILERGSWPDLDELNSLSSSLEEPLETSWPRTAMVGAELNTVTGPLGWRVEGGWWSHQVVQGRWFTAKTSPLISTAAGIDWAHQTLLFLSIEGRWRHLVAPPNDSFLTRPDTIDLAGMARLSLWSDRVEVRGALVLDPEWAEYLTRPEVRWRVSDPLELGIGAVFLGGPRPAPQSLSAAMAYEGGPFGYWGDNDCVFTTLRWIH